MRRSRPRWDAGAVCAQVRQGDEVWHAHILDTAKYAEDSQAAFGYFAHHFPYLGLRGEADMAAWHAAYARTRDLFRQHFGIELPEGRAGGECHNGGSACNTGNSICVEGECDWRASAALDNARPRPDRSTTAA